MPTPTRPAQNPVAFLCRPFGALLALLAAVFVIYAPSLNGQFLWDDLALVKGNLLIRSPLFCFEVFRHTLFDDSSNFFRPTQTLLFIADYNLWGLNPFGYHLASILIHAANAFLLFMLLRQLLPTWLPRALPAPGSTLFPSSFAVHPSAPSWLALGISLLWAVHPVHSAAIAYISGSADSLAMMFCLSAWLLCEKALVTTRSLPRAVWALGAFGCLLFGLCAKEVAFVWLIFFLVNLFAWHPATTRRARWGIIVGGALALAIYLGLRQLPPVPPPHPPYPPMPSRWLLMIRALGDYGSLMLFPAKLFMERQVFAAPGLANPADESVYFSLALAGVGMLTAFAGGAFWPGRGRTLRRVGAGWFLIAFLPMSNLIPLNASVAEHWLYLSSIGFLLFLTGAALDLPAGLRNRRAVVAVVLLAAGALGVRTWLRTFDWVDELTFYRQTIADGGDVPRAREGLAVAYRRADSNGSAIPVLRGIVAKYPSMVSSRINLANALAHEGQFDEARAILEKAAAELFTNPGIDPHVLLAVVRSLDHLEGNDPAWPGHRHALLAGAVQHNPNSWELAQFGINDFERDGQHSQALAIARHFAATHWWHAPAHCALGHLQAFTGDGAGALATWVRASRLDVWDTEALSSAAALSVQENRLDQACDFQKLAVRRQPDSPRQHVLYAQVLSQRGDKTGAAAEFAWANRLLGASAETLGVP